MNRITGFHKVGFKTCAWLVAACLAASPPLWAFTSRGVNTLTASVTVGGTPPPTGTPPQISHTPVTEASPISQVLVIRGTAQSQTPLRNLTVYYKRSLDAQEKKIVVPFKLASFNDSFEVPLPKEVVTSEGVQYRLEADNQANAVGRAPTAGYYPVAVLGYAQAMIGRAGGTLLVPDSNPQDGQTMIDIPAGALDKDVLLTLEQLSPSDGAVPAASGGNILSHQPVSVFRVSPAGQYFSKAVTLRILYPDANQDGLFDNMPAGASPAQALASGNMAQNERTAQSFEWSGSDWSSLGGMVNDTANLVTTRLMRFGQGLYAVFPALAPAPQDFRPVQKIITPGRVDGDNDAAVFGNLGADAKIEIFDSGGRRVRSLQNVFSWDGRDDDGRFVESGLYIYQYNKDGKLVSGVVGVAR